MEPQKHPWIWAGGAGSLLRPEVPRSWRGVAVAGDSGGVRASLGGRGRGVPSLGPGCASWSWPHSGSGGGQSEPRMS